MGARPLELQNRRQRLGKDRRDATHRRGGATTYSGPLLGAAGQPLKVGEGRSHQTREGRGRGAGLAERDTFAVDLFDAVRPTHRRRA